MAPVTHIVGSALDALEQARQAQERFERRTDVQLRLTEPGAVAAVESVAANPASGSVSLTMLESDDLPDPRPVRDDKPCQRCNHPRWMHNGTCHFTNYGGNPARRCSCLHFVEVS